MAERVSLRHALDHRVFELGDLGGARVNWREAVALRFLGVGAVVATRLCDLHLYLAVFFTLALHLFNFSYYFVGLDD